MSNHPFHLVDYSPWPLTGSIGALALVTGVLMMFHKMDFTLFYLGVTLLLLLLMMMTMFQWRRDISREGNISSTLYIYCYKSFKNWYSFSYYFSFVFHFFFWGFFPQKIESCYDIGMMWPPTGIYTFNPMKIPLLNAMILLCSGISITWSHHSMMEGKHFECLMSMLLTVLLGLYFTMLQVYEYFEASFCISDSVYGTSIFMATGLHGIHVIIGTTFILICLFRQMNCHFFSMYHFGFEAAAWYWHFVDVVWLFLYIFIYWWGG